MDRGERRDRTYRKAKSRRRKLLDAVGVPRDEFRRFYKEDERFLDTEPEGKFRNNNVANKYAGRGVSVKTNRRKGHSVHRAKLGAYGPAMYWSPHDQRQLDAAQEEPLPEENEPIQKKEIQP